MKAAMLASAALLLAGCATQGGAIKKASKENFAFLADEPSCAVFLVSAVAPEADSGDALGEYFWTKTLAAISGEMKRLLEEKHEIVLRQIPYGYKGGAQTAAMTFLFQHRCNRVMQVDLRLFEDNKGRYFELTPTLLKVQLAVSSSGEDVAKTQAIYQKSYRFAREPEVFESFIISEFSQQAVDDAISAGAFAGMKPNLSHQAAP